MERTQYSDSRQSCPFHDNGRVTDAAEFVDAALQREASWERALQEKDRLASHLDFYGASVGAVRGAIRDASRRFRGMTHDEITALSSELWGVPVYERRLAAVVLLQTNVRLLTNTDLTRIEGFIRDAHLRALVDLLAVDVVGPMMDGLDARRRARADVTLDRWAADPDAWLRRAAVLAPIRALRAGGGDWAGFSRRVRAMRAVPLETDQAIVEEGISLVTGEMASKHPELPSP